MKVNQLFKLFNYFLFLISSLENAFKYPRVMDSVNFALKRIHKRN